jgi:hypothetical protein
LAPSSGLAALANTFFTSLVKSLGFSILIFFSPASVMLKRRWALCLRR